jgi:serine/threonine protein kinase
VWLKLVTERVRMGGAASFLGKKIHRNDFMIGGVVGIGGFGTVREVRHTKNNVWYALKEYDLMKLKTVKEAEIIINELNTLKRVRFHPFILHLYAAFRDRNTVSFMLDLLPAGDLRLSLTSRLPYNEKEVAYIIACIGSALRSLHLSGILHRDIKPDNIMLTANGIPKLIDFGMSYVKPIDSKTCVCSESSGTKQYIAPEVLVDPTHYHGYESDFWSLGVVMYELLFHRRPYRSIVPLEFVQYSRDTYRAVWAKLLDSVEVDLPTISVTTFEDRTTPNLHHKCLDFGLGLIKDSDLPIDALQVPIPADHLISDHCRSMLSSLLDVRIHRRIGSGRRYESFTTHSWFSDNEIEIDLLPTSPSPIRSDFIRIGDQIFGKYFIANLEIEESTPISLFHRELPDPRIEKLIGSIHYISPEYEKLMASKSK